MPKINRIRIINFTYDSRQILDEMFNFYGGENAFLHLKNGGGKTVLVQAFMQPIVPEVRLQARNMVNYLQKNKQPVYIMIEWKLDDAGGYLLTGITMMPTEGQSAEDEKELKDRIKYFTFTSKYTAANAFDIANIGFAQRKGNILTIMSYREAREMIAEKAKKDPYNFGYFPEEDKARYVRYIAEFGIIQNEWRTIIANINKGEGGLKDYFSRYKTSGQLLDQWIIPTIEQTQNKAKARILEEMLEKLVQEVVENESYILEKQILDDFLSNFQEHIELLNKLVTNLDQETALAGKIAGLFRYLHKINTLFNSQYAENEQKIQACETEKQHIALEERSNDYYSRKTVYETAQADVQKAELQRDNAKVNLESSRSREKINRAAGLAEEINFGNAKLSGVEEKIAATQESFDSDGRIHSLKYSLKLLYEKLLQALAGEVSKLQADTAEKETLLKQTRADLKDIDLRLIRLTDDKARLGERKKQFETEENEVLKKLNINLNRNLLGEIDVGETEKIEQALKSAQAKLAEEANHLIAQRQELQEKKQDIADKLETAHNEEKEESINQSTADGEIKEYAKAEAEIKKILNRYDFNAELCFDRERLASLFQQQIKSLEIKMNEADRIKEDCHEALQSLQAGRLHISKPLAAFLNDNDVWYDTGETYLRSLEPEIRQKLLAGNPLLPYAFIINEADMERLSELFNQINIRQVVPLLTYKDLVNNVPAGSRIAYPQDHLALACLYEGKIFDRDGMEKLTAEFKQKQIIAQNQYNEFRNDHSSAVADQTICNRFNYPANYRYTLENKRKISYRHLQEIKNNIITLKKENKEIENHERKLEKLLQHTQDDYKTAENNVELFLAFIKKEPDYQNCRTKLNECAEYIKSTEIKKAELNKQIEILPEELRDLQDKLKNKQKDRQEAEFYYSSLQNLKPAEIVSGDIEELKERLAAITREHSSEITVLEERRKEITRNISQKRKELAKLKLPAEDYRNVIYDEEAGNRLEFKIQQQEEQLNNCQQEFLECSKIEAAAKNALDTALQEIKRLRYEMPLPLSEIKGNFRERYNAAAKQAGELRQTNNKLSGQINDNQRLQEKIKMLINVDKITPSKDFLPEENIYHQAAVLSQSLKDRQQENYNLERRLITDYDDLKAAYQGKNTNIDNLFRGLSAYWEKGDKSFDDYYFLYEKMGVHAEKLKELITIYEVQLRNLENDKQNMIQQSLIHSTLLYEEIQWISDNSKVNLSGKSRPVQMLEIELRFDNKEAAGQRMEDYISECIQKVRSELAQEKSPEQVKAIVARLMSSRELLNVYLGNPQVQIQVYKVNLNMKKSGLKRWEDTTPQTSGAEKFVAFFAVLTSLMTYSRTRAAQITGGNENNNTCVLIMDNPFGPISSEHLLKPMFEIAKKHRMQLICLSDLEQNSIMNCFNLIYMLKVRISAVGDKEYLKFGEGYIRDANLIQNDEKLEKGMFMTTTQQINLF